MGFCPVGFCPRTIFHTEEQLLIYMVNTRIFGSFHAKFPRIQKFSRVTISNFAKKILKIPLHNEDTQNFSSQLQLVLELPGIPSKERVSRPVLVLAILNGSDIRFLELEGHNMQSGRNTNLKSGDIF